MRERNEKIPDAKEPIHYNFTDLDELIHGGYREITLYYDVMLEEGEEERYPEGIVVDVDDIVIDGNGHSIDAKNMGRIFRITGRKVTIKNITLRNGLSSECGGAICYIKEIRGCSLIRESLESVPVDDSVGGLRGAILRNQNHIHELTIVNSKLENNQAKHGGALYIKGATVNIKKTTFTDNTAKYRVKPIFTTEECGGGAIHNNHGRIIINETVIHKNKAEDGGAIFSISGEISIKNSSITKNTSTFYGGAIDNCGGTITILNTKLNGNNEAIRNNGEMTLNSTTLSENIMDYRDGGAIYNYKELTIIDSTLQNNNAKLSGGAIFNLGTLTIKDSKLINNRAKGTYGGGAINNANGLLTLQDTILTNNTADGNGGAVNNNSTLVSLNNIFENNYSAIEYSHDIYNNGILTLIEPEFENKNKSILNLSMAQINKSQKIEEKIHNKGNIIYTKEFDEDIKNFTYLDELIHNGQKEIILEQDIIKEYTEENKYPEGILIDVDNIVIDGNGYTIDAMRLTRIFKVTAENITIKNITLKNGYANDGGAIHNSGTLTLTNTTLTNNTATGYGGGAIYNKNGKITIQNSKLQKNKRIGKDDVEGYGGAVYNDEGTINIKDTTITQNTSEMGGAIHNKGKVMIENSLLQKNQASYVGGAITNWYGTTKIKNSTIQENTAEEDGAIFGDKEQVIIENCEIKDNKPDDTKCV